MCNPSVAQCARLRNPWVADGVIAPVGAVAYHANVRIKIVLAVGITAGVAAYAAGAGWHLALAAALLAPLTVAAVPHFVAGLRTPAPDENPIDTMSGLEFEDYIARIARSCGAPVIMTSITGDWGVDLVIGRRPDRLAVQCKRMNRPVGTSAVQEVVAGAAMQDCAHTMVVTNNEFTPAARKLAERHDCILVSGTEIPRLKGLIRGLTTSR
ncbi:restriction endonuclease [Mycolicibacterium sp. P9-22]|nr:restriction endonuclease [Mycolicibacterium sp. P9-22]